MAPWAAVLLYLALALPQLALPGLHYDEAKEAGLNAMEMLLRQDVHAFRAAGLQVGTVFLPLMVQDYIGALDIYLALPFLALLGVSVPALRLLGVTLGLGTLLLVWRLGIELSRAMTQKPDGMSGESRPQARQVDRWPGPTGEIAALLLAVSPTFVFWHRQGIFVTNVVVTLAVATVWAAMRWQRTGQPRYLYLAALLAGLGLWAKLLFVWVLGAMAGVALPIWALGQRQTARGRPAMRRLLLAPALFLLALSPLILFNLQTSGTLRSIFGNLGQSYYGVQNAAFLENLSARFGQLVALLRGDHLWYLGGPLANGWAPWAAAVLPLVALVVAALRRRRRAVVTLSLAILFVLLLLVQASFTVSGLFITHFAIIQPFAILLAALAADSIAQTDPDERRKRLAQAALPGLAAATLALWFIGDLQTSVRYHQALAQSGGHATHSDSIYRLAQWLDERQVKQPLALDWGIDAPVRYLTQNRVQPLEIFGYDQLDAPDPGFEPRALQFLSDPSRFYIVRMPTDAVFRGRREALEALAAARNLKLDIEEAFYDRSGKTMFVILRAGPT